MPSFFLEYPPVLVLVMALVGYLLGMILGYLFWGIYMKGQLAGRS